MKQHKTHTRLTLVAALIGLCPLPGWTQLYTEDFNNASSSNNWSLVFDSAGTPDYTSEFGFDYSTQAYTRGGVTDTIPAAPNGSGNTVGVKLTVNNNDTEAAAAAVSLFPNGQSFSGNYALRVDMWINYNGPAFGGSGSTENATMGLNHTGSYANWPSGTLNDGSWFTVTGEAGAAADYQAFVGDGAGPPIPLQDTVGGFLDRDGDSEVEFNVSDAEPDTYPLKLMLPLPDFETAGVPGKNWVQVEVRQRNGLTTWLINGYVIAEHPQAIFTSGNISIGYFDAFNSIANPAADNFVIYDNLRVVDLDTEAELPVVGITASDPSAEEPSGSGTFTITVTPAATNDLTVEYRMAGTAESGADYTTLPGSVVIPAGVTSTNITLNVIDDTMGEPVETAIMVLAGSPGNFDVREQVSATVNIADDSDTPVVNLESTKTFAYELNPDNEGRLTIAMANASASATTIGYTIGGTATNGVDYTTISSSVDIPAGETNAVLHIRPINNSILDGARTVTVQLNPGAGFVLGAITNGTVTIHDDDLPAGTLAYSEDFDVDASANWTTNDGPTDEYADFFFDYSTVGIPSAPNSSGGSTRGVKLRANLFNATLGGFSVSPTGQSFTGNYRVRADVWINYNGPLNGGGSGSTQIGGMGIGSSGTTANYVGVADGLWFAYTGDGGSGVDYRAYSPLEQTGYGAAVFAAGDQNHPAAYYSDFGGESATASQVNLYPQQTGQTFVGVAGMLWRDFVVTKQGDTVTWELDGKLIATVSTTNVTFGGNNILLVHSDINGSSSSDPNAQFMAFSLYDNIRVETLSATSQPVITAIRVVGGTSVQVDFTADTSDTTSSFVLQSAGTVDGLYGDVPAAITQLSPGNFQAEAAVGDDSQFYRIRRN